MKLNSLGPRLSVIALALALAASAVGGVLAFTASPAAAHDREWGVTGCTPQLQPVSIPTHGWLNSNTGAFTTSQSTADHWQINLGHVVSTLGT